jgi:hypothetical protein
LANEQFGFRQNYSTDKAIFKLLNHILNALNNKKTVGGIFCDLRKAFDCVDHAILMSKLEFYGVTGGMYDLIKFCLQVRYQRVVICTHNRQKKPILNGIRFLGGSLRAPSLDHFFFWCTSMICLYFK